MAIFINGENLPTNCFQGSSVHISLFCTTVFHFFFLCFKSLWLSKLPSHSLSVTLSTTKKDIKTNLNTPDLNNRRNLVALVYHFAVAEQNKLKTKITEIQLSVNKFLDAA